MPLALSYQLGCNFNSLKNFQSCLTSRANANVFLCFSNLLNITDSGQDSICLHSLEHCCVSTSGDTESPSKGLPKDSSPNCFLLHGLIYSRWAPDLQEEPWVLWSTPLLSTL